MERVIKFRAWDSHNKVMITPYAELLGGRFWGEDLTNTGYAEPLPEHVMQFTGLTDKNGNEVYEGDIIRSYDSENNPILHTVIYISEEARFGCELKGYGTMGITQKWLTDFEKKVIGNIYENPE